MTLIKGAFKAANMSKATLLSGTRKPIVFRTLMSVTLMLPGGDLPLTDRDEICHQLQGRVDLIVDGGHCGVEPTTILDLTTGVPTVLREGKGDISGF